MRYVHIERALASGAGSFWVDWGSKTQVCAHAHWQAQRDHAYRLNAVQHTPVREQTRMLISVLYKPEGDKRRLLIGPSVVRAVQRQYPGADVEVHNAMNEEPDAQLQWLSRTSILVTNIGSASFRLLYLPDGAQVRLETVLMQWIGANWPSGQRELCISLRCTGCAHLMLVNWMHEPEVSAATCRRTFVRTMQVITVGPLEGKARGKDGKMHTLEYSPFSETDQCWEFMPHLGMLKYHVTSAKDISFYEFRFGKQDRDWEALRIRNAHVHVRAKKLLRVLKKAVARLQEQQSILSAA